MKDLYRRNKLAPREGDPVKINNCSGSEEDREAAFHILLNPERKALYDRSHAALSHIGYIRRQLGLAGKDNWRVRYGDFCEPAHPAPLRKRPRRRLRLPGLRLPRRLAVLLTWPMALLASLSLLPLVWLGFSHQAEWRSDKQAVLRPALQVMHVAAGRAPVLAQANPEAAQLAELEEFDDLRVDPLLSTEDWIHVLLSGNDSGYVSRQLLAPGSGEQAQVVKCRRYGNWRPESGQHLATGTSGGHRLVIDNPQPRDALVKLRDHEGNTEAFFYVRAGESATVDTVPEGRFQLSYAFGINFSPPCGRFLDYMQAVQERSFITFSRSAGKLGRASGEAAPVVQERTLRLTGAGLGRLSNVDF